MRRILLGLITTGAVATVAIYATGAFFSDTETSTGNRFVAGDIDLRIDNESYAIDHNIPGYENPVGRFVFNPLTSWKLVDLTLEKFFNFVDLKPGDYGEDTISIHVGSNDAWMCAAARITDDSDQSCTEPEKADDPTCIPPGLGQGELDEEIQFAFWVDDGDNVYEPIPGQEGEAEEIFLSGLLSGLHQAGVLTLADAQGGGILGDNPIPGDKTFYIGKIWCFGDLEPTNLVQDDVNTGSPLDPRGTGFTCDGTLVDNAAQTDQVLGDLEFYAVQSRNNTTFDCDEGYRPSWTPVTPE
jgi:hypothetical protein